MSLLLQDIRKAYRQPDGARIPVLQIDRFELQQGEQVALMGSSGGGKTTLLNVISGLLMPDSGQVTIAGKEITALPEAARDRFRASYIGFVFQTFNLLPAFTALENVMLGMAFSSKGADRSYATELLEHVGLGHRLNNKPQHLSVGEQQRVSVARALANRPALLLADEPTANVDPANQTRVMEMIRDSCRERNVTLLLVTHEPEAASVLERVEQLHEFNQPHNAGVAAVDGEQAS